MSCKTSGVCCMFLKPFYLSIIAQSFREACSATSTRASAGPQVRTHTWHYCCMYCNTVQVTTLQLACPFMFGFGVTDTQYRLESWNSANFFLSVLRCLMVWPKEWWEKGHGSLRSAHLTSQKSEDKALLQNPEALKRVYIKQLNCTIDIYRRAQNLILYFQYE
jgi:hypothetical protein